MSRLAPRVQPLLRTLRGRVTLAISGLAVLVAVLLLVVVPLQLQKQAVSALEARGEALARMAAYAITPALDFDDDQIGRTQLVALDGLAGVLEYRVIRADGSLFIGSESADAIRGAEPMASVISEPVVSHDRPIGSVSITLDRASATAGVRRLQLQVAGLLMALALLGVIAAPWLAGIVTRPMKEVASVARSLASGGSSDRASLTGFTDADEVSVAFNALMDRVMEGQEQLREANLLLEARVASRTRALEVEVAERRRAQEASSLLAAAVEHSAEVHVIFDYRGIIQYTNPAFSAVSGFEAGEVKGKSGREVWSTEEGQTAWWDMLETVRRRVAWRSTISLLRKDGTPYDLMVTVSPVRGANGEAAKYVSVGYDVTKERALEDQLRHSQKMEAVGRLAGGVAHDFNNLLTAILGYTESLQLDLPPDAHTQEDLSEIRKAAERAASLTSQLLAFSRRQSLELEPVEIGAAIQDVERMVSRLIGTHIDLKLHLPDDPAWIRADRGQLTQILLNLAVNSRDAMPDGGVLEIMAYTVGEAVGAEGEPEGHVVVHVTDTGHGIPREYLERVFEPFFTTKEPGSGTGLGLSTVFGIIEQLGGQVEVESEPEEGTSFRMVFPLISEPSLEVDGPEEPEEHRTGLRILLVDDEESIRRLVRRMLEDEGHQVDEAPNGADALGRMQEDVTFDLLLTDVIMPGISGVALAEQVVAVRPEMPVVLMSGYTAEALPQQGVEEGRYPLVNKPFRRSELRRALAATGLALGRSGKG